MAYQMADKYQFSVPVDHDSPWRSLGEQLEVTVKKVEGKWFWAFAQDGIYGASRDIQNPEGRVYSLPAIALREAVLQFLEQRYEFVDGEYYCHHVFSGSLIRYKFNPHNATFSHPFWGEWWNLEVTAQGDTYILDLIEKHNLRADKRSAQKPEETTMTKKTDILATIKKGAAKGVKQAAVDEAGEVLLQVAERLGGPEILQTPLGRELGKAGAAIVMLAVSQQVDLPVGQEIVAEAAELQTQTAVKNLVQPHMGSLRTLLSAYTAALKPQAEEE